jgi:hypothetical protein
VTVTVTPIKGPRAAGNVADWLLDPRLPAVRRLALLRLLGRAADDPGIRGLDSRLAEDPWVAALLAGQWRKGALGRVRVHPYKKWGGAHWRLVALAELGVTMRTPGAAGALCEAFDQVTAWLLNPAHIRAVPRIDGRYRRCGSQEGNALWAACRIGLGTGDQLDTVAANLVRWQWPDGGWNCDVKPSAHHSSFNESWSPLRALVAYRDGRPADGGHGPDLGALDEAIGRAAEFFLRHRVVESERTGELAHPSLVWLRWPPYWHYGLLPGLRAVAEAGRLGDARVAPALDRLRTARRPDGTWRPVGRWWAMPRKGPSANVEVVDWGAEGETRMLTVHALELLRTAASA